MASNAFLDKINEQFEKSFSLCAVISKEMGCTAESLLAAKRVFSYKPDARPILELFPEFTPVIEKISNLIERYGKELEVDCSPQLWASLGYCYLYLGDFPNAFAAFAHALRLCPEPVLQHERLPDTAAAQVRHILHASGFWPCELRQTTRISGFFD